MYEKSEDLERDIASQRPTERSQDGAVFYFNDHPVRLVFGEMEGVHWMDIHIELPRFALESLMSAKKVLQANSDMGGATPIPTWFGINPKKDTLVFINRLDWRHITAQILDEHIMRCIDQMSAALNMEGV
jgi:hypothetical protein